MCGFMASCVFLTRGGYPGSLTDEGLEQDSFRFSFGFSDLEEVLFTAVVVCSTVDRFLLCGSSLGSVACMAEVNCFHWRFGGLLCYGRCSASLPEVNHSRFVVLTVKLARCSRPVMPKPVLQLFPDY